MAVSAHYVHKQLDRAIEDTGSLDAGRQRDLHHRQPGRRADGAGLHDPDVDVPKPKRHYDAIELRFDKRFSNNWLFFASYTLEPAVRQLLGPVAVGRERPHQPERRPRFDYPAMMFDQDGGNPVYGRLATDRPHQFKAQFVYAFNFGTNVGLNEYLASGVPVTPRAGILPTEQLPGAVHGRG